MEERKFDFENYYKNTLTKKERNLFRALVLKKFDVKPKAFQQWIFRNKIPRLAKLGIIEIIRNPINEFPEIEN